MIRFEEHEGQLFRMLEEPVPLTTDAKLPCLVRLIQDDSPMGRYNRDAAYFDVTGKLFIAQKIKENPLYRNTLHAYEKRSISHDYCIASIHQLEIIGYPVVEGSKEWALYQIKSGKKVVKEGDGELYGDSFYKNRLFYLNGYDCLVTKNAIGFIDPCSEEEFLNLDETGWQLYKEPEQPKYKVGDWVEWCGDQYMVESAPPQSGGRYDIRSPYDELGCSVYPENITRKLSPSEIVVRIGCLSGTIGKSCEPDRFLLWHSSPKIDFDYSIIKLSALDATTLEIVESLLKAQEEK